MAVLVPTGVSPENYARMEALTEKWNMSEDELIAGALETIERIAEKKRLGYSIAAITAGSREYLNSPFLEKLK